MLFHLTDLRRILIEKDYSFIVSTYKLLTASLISGSVGGILGSAYIHSMGLLFWLLVISLSLMSLTWFSDGWG